MSRAHPLIMTVFFLMAQSSWAGVRLRNTDWLDGCEARDLIDTLKNYPNQTFQWSSPQQIVSPLMFQNSISVTCQPGMNDCYIISDFFIDGSSEITDNFETPEWKKSLSTTEGNTQLSVKKLPPEVASDIYKTLLSQGYTRGEVQVFRWVEYGSGPTNHQGLPLTIRIPNEVTCKSATNCSVESQSLMFLPYNEMQECEVPEQPVPDVS